MKNSQPEEVVRQSIIDYMINSLGYPKEVIGVEKSLKLLLNDPEIQSKRRLDIVVYRISDEGLVPLVLIECKALNISKSALRQVEGYNYYLKAPFIAVVGKEEIKFGWKEKEGYKYIDFFPKYQDLIESMF